MRQIAYVFCMMILIYGCCNDDGSGVVDETPEDEIIDQESTIAVNLVFPYEDSLCNEGTNLTPTESTVFFEWEKNEKASGYTLIVENLETGNIITTPTNEIKIAIVIQRSTPYSWYVISESAGVEDEESEVWQFYNAAPGVEFYAPFPAQINTPVMAESIVFTGNTSLSWTGSDVDDDITSYDVYFGTNSNPVLFQSNVTNTSLDVAVLSGTVYYWKIVTKDSEGNSSESNISQFRVL